MASKAPGVRDLTPTRGSAQGPRSNADPDRHPSFYDPGDGRACDDFVEHGGGAGLKVDHENEVLYKPAETVEMGRHEHGRVFLRTRGLG